MRAILNEVLSWFTSVPRRLISGWKLKLIYNLFLLHSTFSLIFLFWKKKWKEAYEITLLSLYQSTSLHLIVYPASKFLTLLRLMRSPCCLYVYMCVCLRNIQDCFVFYVVAVLSKESRLYVLPVSLLLFTSHPTRWCCFFRQPRLSK
jgi:hypothetical protein